jgi:hypothetical protein
MRGIIIDTGNAALGNFFLEFMMKTNYNNGGGSMNSRIMNTP